MATLVSIGEFSRLTHLSVKALRHYQEVGVLSPARIDDLTGYRRYAADQVVTAQLISRLRMLEMPLEEIRDLLGASDPAGRNRALVAHLDRMERRLDETAAAVASLRDLLTTDTTTPPVVEIRETPATTVVAISGAVAHADVGEWCTSRFALLAEAMSGSGLEPAGPSGGLYSAAYFEEGGGEITIFVPVREPRPVAGPATVRELPAATLAVALHLGPYLDLDRTYGALGGWLAASADADAGAFAGPTPASGPIREHYLVSPAEIDDPARLRTEICWPVAAA